MIKTLKSKLFKKEKPFTYVREVVIVFPFNTETKEIFLIQEHIHHYNRRFWKFVSGGVDKDDKDLQTHAVEELAEEVAMQTDSMHHLYSAEPVFGARPIHYYVAENPTAMENPPANPDHDYITDTKWVNQTEFQRMLDAKELIWDQGTMCALQVFRRYG